MTPTTYTAPKDDTLNHLRQVVKWANAEREDFWFPSAGKDLSILTVLSIYEAVRFLGCELEEIVADELPLPFSRYTPEEQKAINVCRVGLGYTPKRAGRAAS